jgi:hypothetical protein
MSRPLSLPPFADNPGSWLAQLRLQARTPSDGPPSPEQIGVYLGVSGATVRRWESGHLAPTDEDVVRFGQVCQLSQHQIDFLRTAFTNVKAPLPPDRESFRANTLRRLTERRAPMVLFDELMYARAWNSYAAALGPHALEMLSKDVHLLESFLDTDSPNQFEGSLSSARKAVRSFWRFTAFFCGTTPYRDLIRRLKSKPDFSDLWTDLGINHDPSEIDISGVAGLLLSPLPKWSMLHSLVIYPPVYTLVEFEPDDEQAFMALKRTRDSSDPVVHFSQHYHWAEAGPDNPMTAKDESLSAASYKVFAVRAERPRLAVGSKVARTSRTD